MLQQSRIQRLNQHSLQNRQYVLYWMQSSQRIHCNHAFEYAKHLANERGKPLLVYFGLTDQFPEAYLRHYTFMLEGLKEVQSGLTEQGIQIIVRHESPELGATVFAENADAVVTDRGYLHIQKKWRQQVASKITSALIQVESDVIVPVETVIQKEAYSAAVLRPKIHRLLDEYLVPLPEIEINQTSIHFNVDSLNLNDIDLILDSLQVDRTVKSSTLYHGGYSQAANLLTRFIETRLTRYGALHNHPELDYQSELSPYLHFGQISSLEIALAIQESGIEDVPEFLEQLIVRRELSCNFVYFNPHHDQFQCLPEWALKTLRMHQEDMRPFLYTLEEFETAQTHDVYWNAAQTEMLKTGKMHGYMRMYWGKKILEWTQNPEDAFRYALYLNNKYNLDGRDPNGYAGVAWCFGKHDRPWGERAIFGSVRYMNANGLKRKFEIETYVKRIRNLS